SKAPDDPLELDTPVLQWFQKKAPVLANKQYGPLLLTQHSRLRHKPETLLSQKPDPNEDSVLRPLASVPRHRNAEASRLSPEGSMVSTLFLDDNRPDRPSAAASPPMAVMHILLPHALPGSEYAMDLPDDHRFPVVGEEYPSLPYTEVLPALALCSK